MIISPGDDIFRVCLGRIDDKELCGAVAAATQWVARCTKVSYFVVPVRASKMLNPGNVGGSQKATGRRRGFVASKGNADGVSIHTCSGNGAARPDGRCRHRQEHHPSE